MTQTGSRPNLSPTVEAHKGSAPSLRGSGRSKQHTEVGATTRHRGRAPAWELRTEQGRHRIVRGAPDIDNDAFGQVEVQPREEAEAAEGPEDRTKPVRKIPKDHRDVVGVGACV